MSKKPVDEEVLSRQKPVGDGIYYQPIDVEVEITKESNGNEEYWLAKDIIVRRKQYNESDGLELLALPDPDENEDAIIEPGDEIVVRVGPESSVAEDGGQNITNDDNTLAKIFTGIVSSAQDTGEGVWKAFAFTYQLDIIRTEIDYSADQQTSVDTIVEEVLQKVKDVNGTDMEFVVDVSEDADVPFGITKLTPTGEVSTQNEIQSVENVRKLQSYTNTRAGEILKDLENPANSTLWVDVNNEVYFGPTNTSLHKLSWIIETDAGFQTPPYQSVKVIGDDIGTETANGWEASSLIPKTENFSETDVSLVGGEEKVNVSFGELEEPTFTYEDESIRTKQEARLTATKLLNNLQEQRASGKITIPGRPMVDLLDVVEMPESFSRTRGGEQFPPAQYIVSEVTHRLNPSDGFITEISVGGLVNRYVNKPFYEYVQGEDDVAKLQLIDPNENEEIRVDLGQKVNIPEFVKFT